MKRPLIAIVMLASLSGAAHSQGSPQTGGEQPVHPGTAILDRMGIDAGKPMPVQKPLHAKAEDTQATRISDSVTKQ